MGWREGSGGGGLHWTQWDPHGAWMRRWRWMQRPSAALLLLLQSIDDDNALLLELFARNISTLMGGYARGSLLAKLHVYRCSYY